MSGRHRRSETLRDKKEEKMPPAEIGRKIIWQAKDLHSSVCRDSSPKRSNSEASDGMMPSNYSARLSWEPLQGNGKVPKDDDINGGRHRMQTDPPFDEWEKQYSTRPSDDSYGLPYRGPVRGMSRDRSRSTYRSRSRSRSRSRGRDWEITRAPSRRSPFCDDRHKSIEYADIRNNLRVSSRPCKDFAAGDCRKGSRCRFFHQEILNFRESWSRTPGDSRYTDYSDRWRNMKDRRLDEDESYLCKDFMKGRCDRGASCRFPHHVDDRNVYDDDRASRRHSNRVPCKFFLGGKCNRDDCKFSHDAPESGHYDNKNWTRNDQQSHAIAKSNFGDKNNSWSGPLWNEVESRGFDQGHTSSDDRNMTWDCTVAPDAVKSNKHNNKKFWNGPSWDDVGKSNNANLDDNNRSWNGPSWDDEVNASNVSNPNKSWNATSTGKISVSSCSYAAKSGNNIGGETKPWSGPSWDEVSEDVGKSTSKWDGPGLNEKASEDANQQILADSFQSVHDLNSQSLSYINGTEQSHHMLLSNHFNGPKIQLNGQVQGMFLHIDSERQMEIQNKDGVKPLNCSVVDVPQVIKDMNETSVNSEPSTTHVNGLPAASLPEISQKGQLPYNQDAKPKEQHSSARSTEVSKFIKTSVPKGILSGSVSQENQMAVEKFPPISCKLGETSVVQKQYSKSPKTKKQEPVEGTIGEHAKQEQENINPDNSEAQGKVEEGNISNDKNAMRQFKMALVEFVKEILKPTWKEGKMSREVHKTVVKKVIDKVTSTIQEIQVPRTQSRIDQYLTYSKLKITKLVEAYVERLLKA